MLLDWHIILGHFDWSIIGKTLHIIQYKHHRMSKYNLEKLGQPFVGRENRLMLKWALRSHFPDADSSGAPSPLRAKLLGGTSNISSVQNHLRLCPAGERTETDLLTLAMTVLDAESSCRHCLPGHGPKAQRSWERLLPQGGLPEKKEENNSAGPELSWADAVSPRFTSLALEIERKGIRKTFMIP